MSKLWCGDERFPDRIALKAASRIARRVGSSIVVDDPDLLEGFAGDESHLDPVLPAAVVRARNAQDVCVVLEEASELGVPVTPRAAGTGKSGGAIPIRGGLVLAVGGLNEVLQIDRENLIVRAQPGVITSDLHRAAESVGLFYPPDPASLDTCCLGGNVAENAGGPRAFKYGVTNRYVLGLEVALASGHSIKVGRQTVKGVAGFDLTSLLVGSEGTLGVFTELVLRLIPKPQAVRTIMVLFTDTVAAGKAVSRMVRCGLVPRVLELMDGVSVETLRTQKRLPIPRESAAMLLIEVDGAERELDAEVDRVAEACAAEGAIEILATRTEAEARQLWAGRRELSELLGRLGSFKLSDDVVVPRSALPLMISRAAEIGDARGVTVACYGHAGDGNLHVNVLWTDQAPEIAEAALEEIVLLAIELGGTITGEHGVGAAKRHLLPREQSQEVIELQRQIKKVFDPKGILNPGKIFF